MARTLRVRTRVQTLIGSAQNTMDGSADGSADVKVINETSTCSDSHGRPVVDSPFTSTQIKRSLVLDGEMSGVPLVGHKYGTVFSTYPVAFSLGSIIETSLPVSNSWFNDVIARTNPSRPTITPPSLIQDLYQLPRMLRDIGKLMNSPKRLLTSKEQANQYLAIQFGWRPFIKDISELLDLQSHILARNKELHRLYSGRGLRRNLTLGKDEQSSSGRQTWVRPGISLVYTYDVKLVRKQWATIRWKPIPVAGSTRIPGDEALNRLSRRLVLGFTREGLARGMWDVLPWSWMINWFVNVGSMIQSRSNTVPAQHSSSCLMNERVLTISSGSAEKLGEGTSNVNISGSYFKSVKTRNVSGSLTSGFNMPYVDMFRLSILSALTVQRLQR